MPLAVVPRTRLVWRQREYKAQGAWAGDNWFDQGLWLVAGLGRLDAELVPSD